MARVAGRAFTALQAETSKAAALQASTTRRFKTNPVGSVASHLGAQTRDGLAV